MIKITTQSLLRVSLLSTIGALIFFILLVPPSLSRYWTVLIFFVLQFLVTFCASMLIFMKAFSKQRLTLRVGASVVITSSTVYCMALSSLGQLGLVDLLTVMFVGSFGVWFMLNPKNQ